MSEQNEGSVDYSKRRPYSERYYLLYGQEEIPDSIDPDGTLELLKELGYGENPLKQARDGKGRAQAIQKSALTEARNGHLCDFCGMPLSGLEYEILKDGRERCPLCSRTAIKKEDEFITLFEEIRTNLTRFFGVELKDNIKVRMVNARTLHRRLGMRFVPTGAADGRVLGVAIKEKKGYTLLIENGSPRMEAIKTMVHELTHIWQYQNWDAAEILKTYGRAQNLEVYEGMAKWVEIQYCFLLGESGIGSNAEIETLMREDEYGRGFKKYCSVYPISYGTELEGLTPFADINHPL